MSDRDILIRDRELRAAKQHRNSIARADVVERGLQALGALLLWTMAHGTERDMLGEQLHAEENIRQMLWVLSSSEEEYRWRDE